MLSLIPFWSRRILFFDHQASQQSELINHTLTESDYFRRCRSLS